MHPAQTTRVLCSAASCFATLPLQDPHSIVAPLAGEYPKTREIHVERSLSSAGTGIESGNLKPSILPVPAILRQYVE